MKYPAKLLSFIKNLIETSRGKQGSQAPLYGKLKDNHEELEILLAYVLMNHDDLSYDPLLNFLLWLLQLKLPKNKNVERQTTEQIRVAKAEREMHKRLLIYEIYKVLNPNCLAGETEVSNFINNVAIRGRAWAERYAGNSSLAPQFTDKDMQLDRENLSKALHRLGVKTPNNTLIAR